MAAQLVLLVAGAVRACPPSDRRHRAGLCGRSGAVALTVALARITFPYLILTVVAVQLSAMLNAIEQVLGGGRLVESS